MFKLSYYLQLLLALTLISFPATSQEVEDIVDIEDIQNLIKNNSSDLQENSSFEIEDNLSSSIVNENESEAEDKEGPRIFGFNFFETDITNKTNAPVLDIPLQANYIISFNDEVELLLSGNEDKVLNLRVDLSGNLVIPELGSVSVLNLTLDQANKKILELVKKSYIGTESYLSIRKPSLKKVSIIGAVQNPGTYLVNPFISLTEALKYASGITENASLRKIDIVNLAGKVKTIDLYDFLIFGKRNNDINLSNGDTIVVNATSNFVEIEGSVHRPMIYEYKEDDSSADLISFALGIKRDGDEKNITATINDQGKKITRKLSIENLIGNKDIEALYIGNNVSIESKDVFVSGNGVTTGFYSASNQKLSNFLKNIKFSSDIYPFYATYEQTNANGLSRYSSKFSLADISSYSDLKVSKNTKLTFFSREDILEISNQIPADKDSELEINEKDLVSIIFPDRSMKVPINGKILPSQVHQFFGSVDEINLEKVSVITDANSFTNAYEENIEAAELVAISFPPLRNEKLIEVKIEGEVLNEGTYLVSSATTLTDIYVLSGGLRKDAFEAGILLFREEVKEKQIKAIKEAKAILTDTIIQKSSNLSEKGFVDVEAILQLANLIEPSGRVSGEFSADSRAARSFVLKDGDSIFIPSFSSEVIVQGEVLNSSSFIFDDSMSYQDYIEAAGGFSDFADKRSVFIIKANGLSVSAGNNIFSGQANIEPGDTIVVPRNLDQLEALPMISMATKIIADIAFSAASLNAIQN